MLKVFINKLKYNLNQNYISLQYR